MSLSKVVTGKVRFSYVHVHEPRPSEDGGKPKYSVAILIDKEDKSTLEKFERAINFVKEEARLKFGGKLPKNFKLPMRDGDEDSDNEEYQGKMFVNASSYNRPLVIDIDKDEILDTEEFYSGCFGRASLNMYFFNVDKNKGIACGLNILQKTEDGEKLSGSMASVDDFDDEGDMLG